MTAKVPLLAPLRHRTFAVLWTGVVASFMSQWMLALAAQWYLVGRPGGAALVPLVQVALTLPMAVLAIPAGVLADSLDRRRLVIVVQSVVLAVQSCLVVLAITDRLAPVPMLVLLGVLAGGMVLTFTPLQSMVPDLVDRADIPAATALMAVATNSARILGPVIAGGVIAVADVGTAFAAAVPLTVLLLVSMLRSAAGGLRTLPRERFVPAVRSGVRFVRHSPQAIKLIVRALWFTVGIVGLFGLLPVLAADLGADAGQLGLLLAAQGVGAVSGAFTLPSLRERLAPNAIVAVGFVSAGAGLCLAAIAGHLLVAGVAVLVAGWAWTSTLATLQAGIQAYLPAWVRARGIALLLTAMYAGQALGAAVLGWVASAAGLGVALGAAATVLVSGAVLAVWLPLKDLDRVDRSSVQGWHSPELHIDPEEVGGQLQVRIGYTVSAADEPEFRAVMHLMRRVRLRTGAVRWRLFKDAATPEMFVEEFGVGSWDEYEHQRRDRSIVSDVELERAVGRLSRTPPVTDYLIRVETIRPD